ncbi:hypothetical protein [Paenibacillus turpanensis]|nr:hypothetical protein [Paenibacillus turpanensis]
MEEANRSLRKFLDYELETVICYHGGRADQDAAGQIRKLIKEL